jgi:hypothetical protein
MGSYRPKLPAVVTRLEELSGQRVAVTIGFADGTTGVYVIPRTYATLEAVRLSALVVATITEWNLEQIGVRNPLTGSYGGV